MKSPGSTGSGLRILADLRRAEVSGILGVVVKCVDIERNTSGEGESLDRS